jgi:hypothetical protein
LYPWEVFSILLISSLLLYIVACSRTFIIWLHVLKLSSLITPMHKTVYHSSSPLFFGLFCFV